MAKYTQTLEDLNNEEQTAVKQVNLLFSDFIHYNITRL